MVGLLARSLMNMGVQALWHAFGGFPCSIIYWKLNYTAWNAPSKLVFFLRWSRGFWLAENLLALWGTPFLRDFVKLLLQLQPAKGELTIKTVCLPLRAVGCGFTAHFSPQTLPSRGGCFRLACDLYAARPGPGTEYPRALREPFRSDPKACEFGLERGKKKQEKEKKKGGQVSKLSSLGIVFHVLDANTDTLYDLIWNSEENRATNVTKTNVERSWF